jgi:hypothetical protein
MLTRMRQRLYPETMPVLASYWLKTICAANHNCGWWKQLNKLLKKALREPPVNSHSRDSLIEIQKWIERSGLLTDKTLTSLPSRSEPFRDNLTRERLAPYIGRLLNEWLSPEVASLLIDQSEPDGIPPLAVGQALERLLVRERLSPETLEMFLQPELLSPQYVYPADAEMLRDVVLALLGRTCAPPLPVMPAAVLAVADTSPLPADFNEAVQRASFVQLQGCEEIHVPLATTNALQIMRTGPMRIASLIVTMDGRWWEPVKLQGGDQSSVVYKPAARLRIDQSEDHARLKIPWPQAEQRWSGRVHLPDHFELFGREWHVSSWEMDVERTWLNLAFSRALPLAQIQPAADACLRRSHPASVDIAWAALGDALSTSLSQHSREPIEQLRRPDFIPLGRAILELVESLPTWRPPKRETIDTRLRAIRFLHSQVGLAYGRIPWRILPESLRALIVKKRRYLAVEVLDQVFETLPDTLHGAI